MCGWALSEIDTMVQQLTYFLVIEIGRDTVGIG